MPTEMKNTEPKRCDRDSDVLYLFGETCTGENRTHHESSKSHRESAVDGEHGHAQTHSHSHDEQSLVVEKTACAIEKRGNQENPHGKPHDEEESQFHYAVEHLGTFHAVVYGY